MSDGVRAMWMRGGTSKGGYFLAEDLPADPAARDAFLMRVMGSPDPRQIDGMGGADPRNSARTAIAAPLLAEPQVMGFVALLLLPYPRGRASFDEDARHSV